jgi:hypothetical protein
MDTNASLVINADDLGVSRGATLGIVRAHREGIVTSASLAVTTPHYSHAVETCVQACPTLGIGLHFTLTSGSPAAGSGRVPLLVDPSGRFRWRFSSLLAEALRQPGALFDQIERELEAQLQRLLTDGIRPDHINGERHIHLIPGIFERVVAAAARHGIRFVRAGRDLGPGLSRLGDAGVVLLNGGGVKSGLLSVLSARARTRLTKAVRTPDYVASYVHTGRLDLVLDRLLARPPLNGITEAMVHPGIPEENGTLALGNRELERYLMSPDRRAELDACVRARTGKGLWQLTNYRALQSVLPA